MAHDPNQNGILYTHDDVIKWKHFPRYMPFLRGIHRSPVNSCTKSRALMFSLIWAWIKSWVYNREAGDLGRYRAHYEVIVLLYYLYSGHLLQTKTTLDQGMDKLLVGLWVAISHPYSDSNRL